MTSPSRWTEIKVAVPIGWHELVADALGHELCTTVQIGDHSVAHAPPPEGCVHLRSYVPSEHETESLRATLQKQLDRLALATQAQELQELRLQFKPLPPEDYAESWRKSWKPFRLRRDGRALLLQPPWAQTPASPQEIPLLLEPGGAFGSGRHATTRTCLAVALERVRGGERVLDAGCGSGVLAVSSLLLGARSAFGFDVDAVAAQKSAELAQDNGVADRGTFAAGGFEVLPPHSFDVVFANIYSDVIQAHASELRQALAPQGWFAFSGCPIHHVDATRQAILGAGLTLEEERLRGRWMTFVGRPRASEIRTTT